MVRSEWRLVRSGLDVGGCSPSELNGVACVCVRVRIGNNFTFYRLWPNDSSKFIGRSVAREFAFDLFLLFETNDESPQTSMQSSISQMPPMGHGANVSKRDESENRRFFRLVTAFTPNECKMHRINLWPEMANGISGFVFPVANWRTVCRIEWVRNGIVCFWVNSIINCVHRCIGIIARIHDENENFIV